MNRAAAKDLETHLAQQIEDLLRRFFPVAQVLLSDGEIALMLVNVGTAMIGSAMTNLLVRAKPGSERSVSDLVTEMVRDRLDRMPVEARATAERVKAGKAG